MSSKNKSFNDLMNAITPDFVDVNDVMKSKRYENIDPDQKKVVVKTCLQLMIDNRLSELKKQSKHIEHK